MATTEQKHKVLKAKVALAYLNEFGAQPSDDELEYTYRLSRVLYKAVLGTHYIRKQQHKSGQVPLF
jgi:hypothetical protein